MTWVCGASTIFGYGALYSDVRVTFANGAARDLIQKAYPVGNFVAAGFAGSVRIGFALLESLTDYLELPAEELQTVAWEPPWISSSWAPIAKSLFDNATEEEKALGSRLLMVGAAPDENCGLGSKIYFTRFASPDFRPCLMSRAIKVCSIGTGAGIREYKLRLKPHFRLSAGINRAEVGQPGGWARQLGSSISRVLTDHPNSGISEHVHILIVRRGSISVETNDRNIYPPNAPCIEIRMPPVANGYQKFRAMAASIGHDAAGASC